MCRSYRFAGTAIFLLTTAVPAASFYALSFDRHIEAFVKERQIALAGRINGVVACKDVDKPNDHVVRYDDEDHDGVVACVSDAASRPGTRRSATICMRHSRTPFLTSLQPRSRCAS